MQFALQEEFFTFNSFLTRFNPKVIGQTILWAKGDILPRTDWNTAGYQLNDSSRPTAGKYYKLDSVDDYVTLPIPNLTSITNGTFEFVINTTDPYFTFPSDSVSGSLFFIISSIGNATPSVNGLAGTPITIIDGTVFSGTRGELAILIADGHPHTIRFTGVNLSNWTALRLGYSALSAGYYYGGFVKSVKVDTNSNGTWDHIYYGTDFLDTVGTAHGVIVGSPSKVNVDSDMKQLNDIQLATGTGVDLEVD